MTAIADLPVLGAPLVAFDVETTGLSASQGHRIVEIALVRRDPDGTVTPWSVLVDAGRRIPAGASRIHGILDDHLLGASTFEEIWPEVRRRMEGTALVAHNAPFDLAFLDAELERIGVVRPGVPVIDTLLLARRHFEFPRNDLATVCRCLGIRLDGAHHARHDAAATLQALVAMTPELARQEIVTVAEAARRRRSGQGRSVSPGVVAALEDGQRDGRTVILHYPGRFGRALAREVGVYSLGGRRLEAWCFARGGMRTFRIDRILRVEPGGRPYEIPPGLRTAVNGPRTPSDGSPHARPPAAAPRPATDTPAPPREPTRRPPGE